MDGHKTDWDMLANAGVAFGTAFERMVSKEEAEKAAWEEARTRTDYTDEFRPYLQNRDVMGLHVDRTYTADGDLKFFFQHTFKGQRWGVVLIIARSMTVSLERYAKARHYMYIQAARQVFMVLDGVQTR